MTVTISRFELYPKVSPNCYCVGFNATLSNGLSMYVDTQVPLEEAKGLDETGISNLAYLKVEEQVQQWVEANEGKGSVVGREFDVKSESLAAVKVAIAEKAQVD